MSQASLQAPVNFSTLRLVHTHASRIALHAGVDRHANASKLQRRPAILPNSPDIGSPTALPVHLGSGCRPPPVESVPSATQDAMALAVRCHDPASLHGVMPSSICAPSGVKRLSILSRCVSILSRRPLMRSSTRSMRPLMRVSIRSRRRSIGSATSSFMPTSRPTNSPTTGSQSLARDKRPPASSRTAAARTSQFHSHSQYPKLLC